MKKVFLALAVPLFAASAAFATDVAGHQVKMTMRVFGSVANESRASIKWGSPDKDDHPLMWTVNAGTKDTRNFLLTDSVSEWEIQTEGGGFTGYDLSVEVDGKPAIVYRFHAEPDGSNGFDPNLRENLGIVSTERSGDFNGTGEGNVRVFTNREANKGAIPNHR